MKDISSDDNTKSHMFTSPVSPTNTIVIVQSLSHIWLFVTLWTAVRQASLSFTVPWSLLKLMSIVSMMSSNHLILCCPLLLLPSIFPSIRVFSNKSALHIRWPKYWSFSFSISPPSEYSSLISFRSSSYQRSPLPQKSDLLLLQNDAHLYPHKLSLLHTLPHHGLPIHPELCNSQRDPQLLGVHQSKNGLETWKRAATLLSECYVYSISPFLYGGVFLSWAQVSQRSCTPRQAL